MKKVVVNKNDAAQRLDKFLTKFLKNMPQSMLYKSIRKKRIKVNGKKGDIAYKLCEGDIIELYINDEFFKADTKEISYMDMKVNINIVYEDENILVVDKKPGMLVHEDDSEKVNTLVNHVKAYLYQKGEYDPENEKTFVPSLCNRIDRNTGGMVIAAKTAEALRIINEKIRDKEIRKFYLCLVKGHLEKKSGELSDYLLKNNDQNRVYIEKDAKSGGKKIVTRYKVLSENELTSLVEVELITGRTHQIRAHFASIGHPLAGDIKYGTSEFNKKVGMKYQALYSYKLIFDFNDENALSYLNGKTLEVKNVPFANGI